MVIPGLLIGLIMATAILWLVFKVELSYERKHGRMMPSYMFVGILIFSEALGYVSLIELVDWIKTW